MVKKSDWFDDFKHYLSEEPVPEVDLLRNREAIFRKLDNQAGISCTRLRKKSLLLVAAIAACLAAYSVYAITSSFFKELRNAGGNISVKFQTATDEIKKAIEEKNAGDAYMDKNFHEVLQERFDALKPGEAEKIIIRSPDRFGTGFIASTVVKDDHINQFDLFIDKMKDAAGFEFLKPVLELPGSFKFSNGQFIYKGDWYTSEEEMEALMAEAESNGKDYAVKPIYKSDNIQSVIIRYKKMADDDVSLAIHVQYSSKDTYILPEESIIDEINHNGDVILTYGVYSGNGDLIIKEYTLVKNDMFCKFSFSKDIGNDKAIEIIDAFFDMQ